ncbi:hypothetical protein ACVWYH_005765 [Bradyrhizobium sp. GM24.11]
MSRDMRTAEKLPTFSMLRSARVGLFEPEMLRRVDKVGLGRHDTQVFSELEDSTDLSCRCVRRHSAGVAPVTLWKTRVR